MCEQGFYMPNKVLKIIIKMTYTSSPIRGSRRYNYTRKEAGTASPDMLHRSDTSDSHTRLYLQESQSRNWF